MAAVSGAETGFRLSALKPSGSSSITKTSCESSRLFMRGSSIDADLAAFDHHVAVRIDADLAASREPDVLALDRDRAVLLHDDARVAGRKGDRVSGGDRQVLPDRQCIILADTRSPTAGHAMGFIGADGRRQRGGNLRRLRRAD